MPGQFFPTLFFTYFQSFGSKWEWIVCFVASVAINFKTENSYQITKPYVFRTVRAILETVGCFRSMDGIQCVDTVEYLSQ